MLSLKAILVQNITLHNSYLREIPTSCPAVIDSTPYLKSSAAYSYEPGMNTIMSKSMRRYPVNFTIAEWLDDIQSERIHRVPEAGQSK